MAQTSPAAIGFIFARGGSKGVPGKNIKQLAGKPLIAHSIEIALACPSIGAVIVSTDDPAIAEAAKAHGAEVPFMRPAELASDSAPEWLAWRHAIEWVQSHRGAFDIFVSLPATSPFRAVEDVEACIAILKDDAETDAVITVKDAERSPYFNMVSLDAQGYAGLVIKPQGNIVRRQDVPAVYDMTTVAYAARPQFVMQADKLFDGRIRAVRVPAERALDIDTPYDFMLAQAIAANRGTGSAKS
jgi:CMP-N-acetylneuraminic acid synthetase